MIDDKEDSESRLLSKEEEAAILREIEQESQDDVNHNPLKNEESHLDLNDFISQSESEIIDTQEVLDCIGSSRASE